MNRNMHPAEQICYVMKRAYQKHMVSSAGGCLSIRDEEGIMWISPTSQDKGNLQPDTIARYSADGKQLSEYAGSMEWNNHLAIYQARPDVKAIFHTHSSGVLSTAFARRNLPVRRFANLAGTLGSIAEIPFSVPASEQLCEDIVAAVKRGANVLTLDSHGAYILSQTTLFDAFKLQDFLEMAARTEAVAPAFGNVLAELSSEQIESYAAAKKAESMDSFEPVYETLAECRQRDTLCELAARGYRNGVVDCEQASFSLRLGEDDFLITPEGKDVANLSPDEIVRVKDGKAEEGKKAPFRTTLHRKIYQANAYAGSVLVGAPAYASVYCITDAEFDCTIDPELTFCIKGVAKYPFATDYATIAAGFSPERLAAVVENDFIVAAAVNGVKTLGIFECMDYASRAVAEMSIRDLKPVQIQEYIK